MKKIPVALSIVVIVLAIAAGAVAGSLITAKTGRTIPILMDVQPFAAASGVSFEDGFAPVVKRIVPAVVNVSSSKIIRTAGGNISSPFFSDPFFRQFFGNNSPGFQAPPSEEREQSLGSGVIVSPDGYILTNNHVINGAKDVQVLLGDKRQFPARIVGADARTDIAVLKIDATGLPVIAFGDSSKMQVGNFVLAVGNPFGLNQTVTLGIVSATQRGGLGIEDYEDFIQTDASINPGNSGGALADERGDLIGINTAIVTQGGSGGNEGIGFAIPGNMARGVMEQILKNGKVTRGWLGVSIQPVTQDIANSFHLSGTYGALISGVSKDSPAARSGLEAGDIVLDIDGQKVDDSRALQLKIGTMSPGTAVKLTLFRNGATREIMATLGEEPATVSQNAGPAAVPGAALRGISVGALRPGIDSQLKLPESTKGVVVTNVNPVSAAAEAGLQQNDVIEEVNRQPVTNVAGFDRAMQSAGGQPVLLLIDRNGASIFMVVQSQ